MNDITCPMCSKRLKLQFKDEENGQMARLYWYCEVCKLSVMKTLTNEELTHFKEIK